MKSNVATILRCPKNGTPVAEDGEALVASGVRYPVIGGVPRFIDFARDRAASGDEWARFRKTQLDSANQTKISYHRFVQLTGTRPEAWAGKRVLEAGCGMGRFLEVLARAGAEVWGADMSRACEVAHDNNRAFDNCQVVQADLLNLPFAADFDLVYSFGVLHHTPEPDKALAAIARHLRPGGTLVVWVNSLGATSGIKTRWVPRPHHVYRMLLGHLPGVVREPVYSAYARAALALRDLPLGRAADVILPIQDLRNKRDLQDGFEPSGGASESRERLRFEWALHSVYDMLTPAYVRQQSVDEVLEWARAAGLRNVRAGDVPSTVIAQK